MTTTLDRPVTVPRHLPRTRGGAGTLLVSTGLVVGTIAVACAYLLATVSPDATGGRYALFWIGMLTGTAPLLATILNPAVTDRVRTWALVGLGLFVYVPKVARSPHFPALYDEKLHFGQASAIDATGALFGVSNPVVPAIEHYPGLHALLVGGHRLTGASYYHVGLVLVALAHVAALLGVRALARRMGATEPVASLAGGLYALTPGFLFFNAMVAYQSLALPVAIWVLVGVLVLLDARPGGWRTTVVAVATVAGIAAVGMTHHVTTGVLCGYLVLLALVRGIGRGVSRTDRWLGAGALVAVVVAVVVQVAFVGGALGQIVSYVLPESDAFTLPDLSSLFGGDGEDGPARTAFAGSVLPTYEQLAGFGAPAITCALAVAGAWLGRDRLAGAWVRRLSLVALVAYPATFPLILSARTSTWAHRSWPFLMVLLCPLLAAGVVELVDRVRTGTLPRVGRVRLDGVRAAGPVVVSVMVAALCVWFVGNTATSTSDYMRFPGPHQLGVEGRSTDEHTLEVATWLAEEAGPGARIVSDASTATDMVAFAGAWKVRGFPVWTLVQDPETVGPRQVARTIARDVDYLVVDTRMAGVVPDRGFMYEAYEDGAYSGRPLVGVEAMASLAMVDWAVLEFSSGPISVYSFDTDAAGVTDGFVRDALLEVPDNLAASDRDGWALYGYPDWYDPAVHEAGAGAVTAGASAWGTVRPVPHRLVLP